MAQISGKDYFEPQQLVTVAASSLGDEVLDGDITRQLGLRYKRVPPLLQLLGKLAQLRPARPRPRPRIRSLRAAADSFT